MDTDTNSSSYVVSNPESIELQNKYEFKGDNLEKCNRIVYNCSSNPAGTSTSNYLPTWYTVHINFSDQ